MKYFILFLVTVANATASIPYLAWMADSFIERGVTKGYHYTEATLNLGIQAAYELTKNDSYTEWYKGQIDAVVLDDGTIKNWRYDFYSLDEYRMANNFLWWFKRTGEKKYKEAAKIVREQINRHPRTATGGLWHRDPNYPHQMWLDGIFMVDSFYARWTRYFDADNATAWDDIVLQFDNIEAHTRNQTTGLMAHGYDESKVAVWADPITGAAPLVWDRAVGWYFLALLEVIEVFPKSHPGYTRLMGYYTTLATALKKTQDESGGWWLIMSEPYPGKEGNYIESSATAMFAVGWFKGIRMGILPEIEYLAPAQKAYTLLTDRFVEENSSGLLDWKGTVEVGSLSSNGTFEVSGVPLKHSYGRYG